MVLTKQVAGRPADGMQHFKSPGYHASIGTAGLENRVRMKGRVYLDGHNVLFHVAQRPAPAEHHPLSDVRGSHNGWHIDVSMVSRLLGYSVYELLQQCEA